MFTITFSLNSHIITFLTINNYALLKFVLSTLFMTPKQWHLIPIFLKIRPKRFIINISYTSLKIKSTQEKTFILRVFIFFSFFLCFTLFMVYFLFKTSWSCLNKNELINWQQKKIKWNYKKNSKYRKTINVNFYGFTLKTY